MAFHKRVKSLREELKDKTRLVFRSGHRPAHSTSSLPVPQSASPNLNPAPSPLAAFTAAGHAPTDRPVSAPNGIPKGVDDSWPCLKRLLRVLDTSSGAVVPLKLAVGYLSQCLAVYEGAAVAQQDYQALRSQLEQLFHELSSYFIDNLPPTMTASMNNLCTAIEKELDCISDTHERRAWRRHLEAERDLDKVMKCYRRIQGHLERLTLNANLNTWKIVNEQVTESRLKSLSSSMSACYDSAEAATVRRRECTPETRKQVLATLSNWRHNKDKENMYWLNGMAGTGKTTIATSLCAMLDRSHELGASFFCTRLLPECRNIKLILPTIAYQLARFSHPFRYALSLALERDPDIHTRALSKQFEGMIAGPLREVARAIPTNLVVVIDALDECDDPDSVGQMLEMLAKQAPTLPIKVFVSSRPEPQIRQKIGAMESQMVLHELEESIVREDIETYLRVELADMKPSASELANLVDRAGALFIYAATVVRYIGAESFTLDPRDRLATVLGVSTSTSSNKNKDIDALYATVLNSAFNNPHLEPANKERMKLVLDIVICAYEPLTVATLAVLLQMSDADQVQASLRPLWSVLHISEANHLVTTLHASFPDYMLDSDRSKEYECKAETRHGQLAELCFQRIEGNKPQFNICGLESSYRFDQQVPDLKERVRQAIPLDLLYACLYWAAHLELGEQPNRLVQMLEGFLSKQLLLWMEVLNLRKRMKYGVVLMEKVQKWCTAVNCPQDIQALVQDAQRFVTVFSANPISQSTPHLYVSMLASWPDSQPLIARYIQRARGLVHVGGTGITQRQLASLSVLVTRSVVRSVAFSPNGMRIVSGSDDNTICVWDAQSGKMVLKPLKGHAGPVWSVAFSPDGMYIVSGSKDHTIHAWDAQSGKMVLGPLKGHTGSVYSVASSPNGIHIGSGSEDKTVCVWDAQSEKLVLGPLKGHAGSVNSVAFSPNGMRIASGSDDTTIRVWGAQSGKTLLGPLQGHTGSVMSVAFSPDGTRVVSGSDDATICVWDAQSGQIVLGPLEGHSGPVYSVVFSPNGMCVISGSGDKTIRVWDARGGQMVLGPLEEHSGSVYSVASSPDSTRIVSCSYDKTTRVWDAQSEQIVLKPLEGHTGPVWSVAFSPDNMCIVSGSKDHTIRAWGTQSGQMLLGPLRGHTRSVWSVAFSPDGTHIASGSDDKTIRVWNAQSEQLVLGPLEGHTDCVGSVVFSPDGTRIVSASYDKTIRVWDAQSGQMVLGPLKRHTGSVWSVALSPDGMRIVSGSSDMTICVWDAQSGQTLLGPLEGHAGPVWSVVFSPDGMRMVSGSKDKTIRVWDAQSGQMVLGPLKGHTGSVYSVASSPDGMRIVSGSDDKTICVWDAQSGKLVSGPLKGHTGSIYSV